MIRIRKPTQAPTVLATDGDTETQNNCRAYLANQRAYKKGTAKFKFDSSIYGHPTVKEELKDAQHKKCAFCESFIMHVQPGDVEHFRPKAAIGLAKGRVRRPGYYWLAYDWDNLLLACEECNRRHKRNAFPLLKGSRRARSHLDNIATELPFFIHPGAENPETEIAFREHVPYPRNNSVRGRRTINALGLKRKELMSFREEHIRTLKVLRDALVALPPGTQREKVKAHLARAQQDEQQFSAMARCFPARQPL